jgi:molybdopterin molybdotransferase
MNCLAHVMSLRGALPMFDNSAMDGYAPWRASTKPTTCDREQPAGIDRGSVSLGNGSDFQGPIPAGADAVIMQEDTTRVGDRCVVRV